MDFTLRFIFSGLCAFVPLQSGKLLALLVDARHYGHDDHDHDKHYPRLSIKLKNTTVGGEGERSFMAVIPDLVGEEIGVFELDKEKITLEAGAAKTKFLRYQAMMWGTERPQWFIPSHEDDARWVVETKEYMDHPKIKERSLEPWWEDVVAAIELSVGRMETFSIPTLEDSNRYAVWEFESQAGTIRHSQALADRVVINIPMSGPKAELRSVRFKKEDSKFKPFPKLEPLREGDIVEISVTNLPLKRFEHLPEPGEHFELFRRLAADEDEFIVPKLREEDGTVAGSGVICPMITFGS